LRSTTKTTFTSSLTGWLCHGSAEHDAASSNTVPSATAVLALEIDFDNIPGLAHASGCNIDAEDQP
jgi:hypothetical protein